MKKITLSILALVLPTLVNADIYHFFAVPAGTDVAGFISASKNPVLDNTERLVSTDSTGTALFAANAVNQSTNDAGDLLFYTTTNNAATIIQNLLDANPIYANADGTVAVDFYHFVENTDLSIFNSSGVFVYYNSSEITENPFNSDPSTSVRNEIPDYNAILAEGNASPDVDNKDEDTDTDKILSRAWGVISGAWIGINTNVGKSIGSGTSAYIPACGDVAGVDGKLITIECIGGGQFAPDSPQRLFTADFKLATYVAATNLNIGSVVHTDSESKNYNFVINKALAAPALANEATAQTDLLGNVSNVSQLFSWLKKYILNCKL